MRHEAPYAPRPRRGMADARRHGRRPSARAMTQLAVGANDRRAPARPGSSGGSTRRAGTASSASPPRLRTAPRTSGSPWPPVDGPPVDRLPSRWGPRGRDGVPPDAPRAYPSTVAAGYCTGSTDVKCWPTCARGTMGRAWAATRRPSARTRTGRRDEGGAAGGAGDRPGVPRGRRGGAGTGGGAGADDPPSTQGDASSTRRGGGSSPSRAGHRGRRDAPGLSDPEPREGLPGPVQDVPRRYAWLAARTSTRVAPSRPGSASPRRTTTRGRSGCPDTRIPVKPVMTVVYAPANDMLHAFRAGPCYSPRSRATARRHPRHCAERGGEELWGFVPYDQLEAVRLRAATSRGTGDHVGRLARGSARRRLRAGPRPHADAVNIGGETIATMQGVWRTRHLLRARHRRQVRDRPRRHRPRPTATALSTVPTAPGSCGAATPTAGRRARPPWNGWGYDEELLMPAWAKRGPCPSVAFVQPIEANLLTPSPPGAWTASTSAIFMAANTTERHRPGRHDHDTLDVPTGEIVAAVDVEDVAVSYGPTRASRSYLNADRREPPASNWSVLHQHPGQAVQHEP